MSVLAFIDESRWQKAADKAYFVTVAGVAFEEQLYGDFCRRLLRLKGRFFHRSGVGQYSLQGRLLLNSRALEQYRKVEFVRELFSLCRLQKVAVFSTTKLILPDTAQAEMNNFPAWTKTAISASDKFDESSTSILLAYLIESLNGFMLERHPGQLAKLIFQSEDAGQDRLKSASLMHLFYQTPFGGGFRGVLGAPFFLPACYSPGLQVADLCAYIINQHHGDRAQIREFFEEVETLEYLSQIRQDDYEFKGINIIE